MRYMSHYIELQEALMTWANFRDIWIKMYIKILLANYLVEEYLGEYSEFKSLEEQFYSLVHKYPYLYDV